MTLGLEHQIAPRADKVGWTFSRAVAFRLLRACAPENGSIGKSGKYDCRQRSSYSPEHRDGRCSNASFLHCWRSDRRCAEYSQPRLQLQDDQDLRNRAFCKDGRASGHLVSPRASIRRQRDEREPSAHLARNGRNPKTDAPRSKASNRPTSPLSPKSVSSSYPYRHVNKVEQIRQRVQSMFPGRTNRVRRFGNNPGLLMTIHVLFCHRMPRSVVRACFKNRPNLRAFAGRGVAQPGSAPALGAACLRSANTRICAAFSHPRPTRFGNNPGFAGKRSVIPMFSAPAIFAEIERLTNG